MENQNTNFLSSVRNAAPETLDVQTTKNGGTQMNVVNAINANGIVSGRKVVDFIWQRIGICAMIIAAGCLIAVIVMVVIANKYNTDNIKIGFERDAAQSKLDDLYKAMKVSDQAEALTGLSKEAAFDGEDMSQVIGLVVGKYGMNVTLDFSDNSIMFLKKNGIYKVLSFGLKTSGGTVRVLAYSPSAKANWSFAAYDPTNKDNPCEKSTDDEKAALENIVSCPEDD